MSRFPRKAEMHPDVVVLCSGSAGQYGLPTSGQRNALGMLHGSRNEPNLTGTLPILTALFKCNSDVQIVYRVPICDITHSQHCLTLDKCKAHFEANSKDIELALQRAQDSAIGYFCDYAAKRQPVATKEIKRWMTGHDRLAADLKASRRGESVQYIARRHTQRFLSDSQARGTARGGVEVVNLICNRLEHDVTAAESFKSAITTNFAGKNFVALLEAMCLKKRPTSAIRRVPLRVTKHGKFATLQPVPDIATMYGYRGTDCRVHFLAAYEFVSCWTVAPVAVPLNPRTKNGGPTYHVDLTHEGRAFIFQQKTAKTDYVLEPGCHFTIQESWGTDWLPFPDIGPLSVIRHLWVMVRNPRPVVPKCTASPMAVNANPELSAKVYTAYFRPWVAHKDHASQHVPHVLALCDGQHHYLSEWCSYSAGNILTWRLKRFIHQFMCVCRIRDCDDFQDEPKADPVYSSFQLPRSHLYAALNTHVSRPPKRLDGEQASKLTKAQRKHAAHAQSSLCAIDLAKRAWSIPTTCAMSCKAATPTPSFHNLTRLMKAARGDGDQSAIRGASGTRTPHVASYPSLTPATVDEAYEVCATKLNKGQQTILHMVAVRVKEELDDELQESVGKSEPLRWLVLGEPGTGKSWLYRVLAEFLDMLGFIKDVHYAFAAFQGRMARSIGGGTLHQLVGLGLRTSSTSSATETLLFLRPSTLRWLFIDEISMVSPRLHALVESRLRTYTQAAGTYKHAPNGHIRSFGGLNVIESGDFWQLPPPGEGHSLMTIPPWLDDGNEKVISALVRQGLELLWGTDALGIAGMTELTENMRFKDDAEFQAVLKQCRHGVLSTAGFDRLKELILTNELDRHLKDELFANAAVIVATNDLKYAINKQRSQLFAVQQAKRLTWCPASDKPATNNIGVVTSDQYVRWLQYHDRWTASLYGMLPLVEGLPVLLTHHIDPSTEKNLLQGTKCTLHSWVCDPREPVDDGENDARILQFLPLVVFVKVLHATWTVPGLQQPGLYPLRPIPQTWYLDHKKEHPVLSVNRRQLPIAPAFGVTTHFSQGETRRKALVDLTGDFLQCYVAISRVRSAKDLLIYRPFDPKVFQQGDPPGPKRLLEVLREKTLTFIQSTKRNDIHVSTQCIDCGCWDYQNIHSDCLPIRDPFRCPTCQTGNCTSKWCRSCGLSKPSVAYSGANWRASYELRQCKLCRAGATTRMCKECNRLRLATEFGKEDTCKRCTKRTCTSCGQSRLACEFGNEGMCGRCTTRVCPSCNKSRMACEFSKDGKCSQCTTRVCPSCNKSRMACEFSKDGKCSQCTTRVCPSCKKSRLACEFSKDGKCNQCTTRVCPSCKKSRLACEFSKDGKCNQCTTRVCPSCKKSRVACEFDKDGKCRQCTTRTCPSCNKSRLACEFNKEGTCKSCNAMKSPSLFRCAQCDAQFPKTQFSATEFRNGLQRRCKKCMVGHHPKSPRHLTLKCSSCDIVRPRDWFSKKQWDKGRSKRCKICVTPSKASTQGSPSCITPASATPPSSPTILSTIATPLDG